MSPHGGGLLSRVIISNYHAIHSFAKCLKVFAPLADNLLKVGEIRRRSGRFAFAAEIVCRNLENLSRRTVIVSLQKRTEMNGNLSLDEPCFDEQRHARSLDAEFRESDRQHLFCHLYPDPRTDLRNGGRQRERC